MSTIPIDQQIQAILEADPSASQWLKSSLRSALQRDPVDAANDAELLALILAKRAVDLQGQALANMQTPPTIGVPRTISQASSART